MEYSILIKRKAEDQSERQSYEDGSRARRDGIAGRGQGDMECGHPLVSGKGKNCILPYSWKEYNLTNT